MIFKYGTYSHEIAEVGFRSTAEAVRDRSGRIDHVAHRWTITGVKFGDDIDDLTSELTLLRLAYSVDGQDAGLYKDDGTTATTHVQTNSFTIGGIRVESFNFPEDGRQTAEYSTFRTFQVVLAFEVLPSTPVLYTEFEETLTFVGGGPRNVFVEIVNGPPVLQTTAQQTVYTAIQSGRMMTQGGYLTLPAKIWPGDYQEAQSRVSKRSARLRSPKSGAAGTLRDYVQTWSWVYQRTTPFAFTNPTQPPST